MKSFKNTACTEITIVSLSCHYRAINVHIWRSIVSGRAGGHVPGRSAAYENQA